MFEDALLESSPRRTPVLRRIHYLSSALAGTLVFAQGLFLLPWFVAPAGERALMTMAAMVGALAAVHALMLCYIWSDARQHGLSAWPWMVATLLLSLPGLLIYLVYAAVKSGDWRRAAIPLAYVVESMIVGVMVLVPLIYTQAIPRNLIVIGLPPLPPPGRPPAPPAGPIAKPLHHPAVDPYHAPACIPTTIVHFVDAPEPQVEPISNGPWVPGVPQGFGGVGGNGPVLIGSINQTPPPPEPVVHAAPKPPTMVYVSKGVIAAKGIYQPRPDYPPLARMARIQGTVMLQAIIGKDGTIQNLKVLSGPAMLVPAAVEAVKSWRYQPTLLSDEPVDVQTEIDVKFTLSE